METLAIVPALTLMLPALGPFLLTLILLLGVRRVAPGRPLLRTFLEDFSILAGILLAFGLFDPASLVHFANPERPMDWIPDLAGATFLSRTVFSLAFPLRINSLFAEMVSIMAGSLILLFPLLRQHSLQSGLGLLTLTSLVWISVRLFFPGRRGAGLDPALLLPVLLVSGTLSLVSPLSGSLLLGQLAGGLAAVLAAILFFSLMTGTRVSGIETGITLGALVVIGRQYAEIPLPIIAGLLVALAAGSLGNRIFSGSRRLPKWAILLLPAFLSIIPLGGAILYAVKNLQSSGGGY